MVLEATNVDAVDRSTGPLGSSKSWPKGCCKWDGFPAIPGFFTWFRVFLDYLPVIQL